MHVWRIETSREGCNAYNHDAREVYPTKKSGPRPHTNYKSMKE